MRFAFAFVFLGLFLLNACAASAQMNESVVILNQTIVHASFNITITLNKEKFSPGERIKVMGAVQREDGSSDINGEVYVRIDKEHKTRLNGGSFAVETTLDNLTKSGQREIEVEVLDEQNGKGIVKKGFYVAPDPAGLDVYLNKNSFLPGVELNASASLLDQNGEKIEGAEIVLTIYDSRGATIMKNTLAYGWLDYTLPGDAIPGEWWVYAYSNDIKARRFFNVEESRRIEYSVDGGMLSVKNVGNVIYTDPISVTFSGNELAVTEVKDLNLEVGVEKRFSLSAPEGKYRVYVTSLTDEKKFEGIPLTGGAVGVSEPAPPYLILYLIGIGAAIVLIALAARAYQRRSGKAAKAADQS